MGACWAHNPEVDGSKPSSANPFFFFVKFFLETGTSSYTILVLLSIFTTTKSSYLVSELSWIPPSPSWQTEWNGQFGGFQSVATEAWLLNI